MLQLTFNPGLTLTGFRTTRRRSSQELVQKCPCIPGSNWNLEMLVFEERGKPEYPEKNLSEQTQPTYDAGSGNRTRATLVGGERFHHYAIPAPLKTITWLSKCYELDTSWLAVIILHFISLFPSFDSAYVWDFMIRAVRVLNGTIRYFSL